MDRVTCRAGRQQPPSRRRCSIFLEQCFASHGKPYEVRAVAIGKAATDPKWPSKRSMKTKGYAVDFRFSGRFLSVRPMTPKLKR
ncbi:hypothetical protein ALP13_200044 [Pseudomonas syringae pv. maculicola]|uniref:Uncharacterized protein n=1 Tax=Pseudomonas syringae pv. maculicola TaxID=59511 RepID=A0A3M6BWI5_PSEYM|nr:hypothetical protein ALP13_200044 [Pseudomonas syringae pv. maculicola]